MTRARTRVRSDSQGIIIDMIFCRYNNIKCHTSCRTTDIIEIDIIEMVETRIYSAPQLSILGIHESVSWFNLATVKDVRIQPCMIHLKNCAMIMFW